MNVELFYYRGLVQGYCIRVGNVYFISILGVVPRLAIVILDSFFPEAVLRGLCICVSLPFGFVGILTSVFTFPGSPQKTEITYGVKAYLRSFFFETGRANVAAVASVEGEIVRTEVWRLHLMLARARLTHQKGMPTRRLYVLYRHF